MANRYFKQFTESFDTNTVVVDGYGQVTDSVGTISFTAAGGVTSFVRNSTGNYTITLQDQYNILLNPDLSIVMPSGTSVITTVWKLLDPLVTKTFTFQCLNTSNAAVDPPPQAGFYFCFLLKNSGLARGK